MGTNCTQQVLHPGLKLEYFRQHDWEKEWVDQAETLVREEYAASYEKVVESEGSSPESSPLQVCSKLLCLFNDLFTFIQGNEGVSLFANFSVGLSTATSLNEVDEYLNRAVENVPDPLKWWNDNRRVYPNLSSMALDYLSIPHK
jgi:hypothetical protein